MSTTTKAKVDAAVAHLNAVKAKIAELTGDNSIIGRGTIALNMALAEQCGMAKELDAAMVAMWDEQCKDVVDATTQTIVVTTNAELKALNLSFFTLSKLAQVLNCVNPCECLEHRLTHPAFAPMKWKGLLTLDKLGNFVSFA